MAETDYTTRVYEYKVCPTKKLERALDDVLEHCRQLYNTALSQRKMWWELSKSRGVTKSCTWCSQSKDLTELRQDSEFSKYHRHTQQDVLKRVDITYSNFFRKIKDKTKSSLRFKAKGRYRSFVVANLNGYRCILNGSVLNVPGIGSCKLVLHRACPGKIRRIRMVKKQNGWHAQLTVKSDFSENQQPTGKVVGIDVGITNFATLSDGSVVDNPRFLQKSSGKLAEHQRKGNKKAVAKLHAKVARQRKHFHHETSRRLVNAFDAIAVEDLKVSKMIEGSDTARSIGDAGWSQFVFFLSYKAASAGRTLEKVNPAHTTQTCSGCGSRRKIKRSATEYVCVSCGLVMGRDHNAAVNILRLSGAFNGNKTVRALFCVKP